MNRFTYSHAGSVAEAAAQASATVADAMTHAGPGPGARDASVVKAGGIDLLDLMKEDLLAPKRVVSLTRIAGLDAVREDEAGGVRIGATATLARLVEHPALRRFAALVDALRESASPQIRNVATLGGNLLQRPRCWYFRAAEYHCLRKGGGQCFALSGDNRYHAVFDNQPCAIVHPSTAATALVALNATVELTDARGAVREPLLENFFARPGREWHRENDLRSGEILTAVSVPRLPAGARSAHVKQGEKDSFDWPLADVAVRLDITAEGRCGSAAVILGAAAPAPHRAGAAERVLAGRPIDEGLAREAGRAALQGAAPLSGNAFKLPLFETLVARAVMKAAAGG